LSPVLDDRDERRRLVSSVCRVRFSVNGASEQVYAAVQLSGRRLRGLLARVLGRIEDVVQDRHDLGADILIGLSFVVVPQNWHELEEVVRCGQRLGVDFLDVLVDIEGDAAIAPEAKNTLDALRQRARRGEFGALRVRVSGRTGTAPALTPLCATPRLKVAVDPFGYVWRCCHTANPEHGSPAFRIGDLRAQSLGAILRSSRVTPLATGCRTCPDFERTFNALVHAGRRVGASEPSRPSIPRLRLSSA
jgi:MoaA/NifB/PqqE/SkfB family radical SAM enzyme